MFSEKIEYGVDESSVRKKNLDSFISLSIFIHSSLFPSLNNSCHSAMFASFFPRYSLPLFPVCPFFLFFRLFTQTVLLVIGLLFIWCQAWNYNYLYKFHIEDEMDVHTNYQFSNWLHIFEFGTRWSFIQLGKVWTVIS